VFDENDRAEMDRANDRVDAEMKLLESEAKARVAEGLLDPKIAKEAEQLRRQAESELHSLDEKKDDSADQ
jgi:hypothetical protein